MVQISIAGRIGQGLGALGTGIRDMVVVAQPGGPVVLASSGATGGLVAIGYGPGGQPQLSDARYHDPAVRDAVGGPLSVLQDGGGARVLFGTGGPDWKTGYALSEGRIGARADLTGSALGQADAGGLAQLAGGIVFAAGADGVLRGYRPSSPGALQATATLRDDADTHHAAPVALAAVSLRGRDHLLTLCGRDPGLSLFRLAEDGSLQHAASLGTASGLGLHAVPVALETATLAGRHYAIVASAAAQGDGAALSVVEITESGGLAVTDHLLDGLATRFARVTALAVVESADRVHVAVAGGDQGVSLFTLMPGGRLLHLHSLAGSLAAGLGSIAAMTAVAVPGGLGLLVADQTETGLVALSVALEPGETRIAVPGGGVLRGGAGDDMLVGDRGADRIEGGAGDDILFDGAGSDTLVGGDGADRFVLAFDGGPDVIEGFEAWRDRLDLSLVPMLYDPGGIAVSSVAGGARLAYRGETLLLRSATGQPLSEAAVLGAILWDTDRPPLVLRNSLDGTGGDDILPGGAGQDLIRAGAGNDLVSGLDGADDIGGGSGADTIRAGAGDDIVRGGAGRDLVFLGPGDDLFEDEAEDGAPGSDTVLGGSGNDTLLGLGGADELHGEDGDDSLSGGPGADTLFGGINHDTLMGGDGDDRVWGGDGRDLAWLGAGNDIFFDTAQGGPLGSDTVHGGAGDDTIQGGNGDDVFDGDAGDDVIFARLGNDIVRGGDGADLVFLGAGNDRFTDSAEGGAAGRDTVFGGAGDDTLEAAGGDDVLHGEAGNDLIGAGADNDLVHGGDGFDTIAAGDGNDTVHGGNGRDLVWLGTGHDLFVDTAQGGDLGRDTVFGGPGADTIQGGAGDDLFFGEAGDDLILARRGDDLLYGGAGNDRLEGGPGNDRLWGGPGGDRFVFRAGDGRDTIWTFDPAVDRLLLDPALWGGGARSAADILRDHASLSGLAAVLDFGAETIRIEDVADLAALAGALDFL